MKSLSTKRIMFFSLIGAIAIVTLTQLGALDRESKKLISISISPNAYKGQVINDFRETLGWSTEEVSKFESALHAIQWDKYKERSLLILTKKYGWDAEISQRFLTHSAYYHQDTYDLYNKTFVPDTYVFSAASSPSTIAFELIEKMDSQLSNDFIQYLDEERSDNIHVLIANTTSNLPNLYIEPIFDIQFNEKNDFQYVRFSTSYWNSGHAPFSLVVDEVSATYVNNIMPTSSLAMMQHINTSGHTHDRESVNDTSQSAVSVSVFQEFITEDNEPLLHEVGTYEWHFKHLHYHFTDFMTYELLNVDGTPVAEGMKTSYCLRDVEHFLNVRDSPQTFLVCDPVNQGLSPGWGDTYYFGYAGQSIDITKLPTGEYILRNTLNPYNNIKESDYTDNVAETQIYIDKEQKRIITQ